MMVPRVFPSTEERNAGELCSHTVEFAARGFRTTGALILEEVVEARSIAHARQVFGEAYADHLDGRKHDGVLEVGDRRVEITVDLEPPFNDPGLFANPWLWPILNATLDEGFVIDSFGVVCSLPGAPEQHQHTDGGILFPHSGIDRILPAAAIVVAIPLLEMNGVNGTTALWPRSHREGDTASKGNGAEPVVREGSCLIWDYRLKHSGTANRSAVPRPLLCITYCRPWWVDHVNFATRQKPRLRAPKSSLQGFSEIHRSLLVRAKVF